MRKEKIKSKLSNVIILFILLFSSLFIIKNNTYSAERCTAPSNGKCAAGCYLCGSADSECCLQATPVPGTGGGTNLQGSSCCGNNSCSAGLTCVGDDTSICYGSNGVGKGFCEPSSGGGGGGTGTGSGTGTETNVKCNCSSEFGACGDKFGQTNIKWRQCQRSLTGRQTCNARDGLKFYQTEACAAWPTVTPGGPTLTPTSPPTPTDNPNCGCAQGGQCGGLIGGAGACQFNKFSDITTYSSPIKCGLSNDIFQSAPTDVNKKAWCRAENRTKGDADGNGTVTFLDYFYFVSAKAGAKIPATVNPDFNGDNAIDDADRAIIIKSLKP